MKGPAFIVLAVLLGAHGVFAQLNVLAKLAGKQYFGSAVDNPALSDVPYRRQLSNWLDFGQITAVRLRIDHQLVSSMLTSISPPVQHLEMGSSTRVTSD